MSISGELRDNWNEFGFEARPAPNGGWVVFRRDIRLGEFPVLLASFTSPTEMLDWLGRNLLSDRSEKAAE